MRPPLRYNGPVMVGRNILLLAGIVVLAISGCSGMSEAERAHDAGIELAIEGKYEEAISEFDRAIELDPSFAEAYGARGQTYGRLEEYDKALADTDMAVKLAPEHAYGYYQRALIKGIKGEVDAALADLNKAAELDADDPDVFMTRADIHISRGDCEAAISDFTKGFATGNFDTKTNVAAQLAQSCPDWLGQSPGSSLGSPSN